MSQMGKSCPLREMAALRKGTGGQPQACNHTLCLTVREGLQSKGTDSLGVPEREWGNPSSGWGLCGLSEDFHEGPEAHRSHRDMR